jgi:amyloid beta precursor protein binding protein 1
VRAINIMATTDKYDRQLRLWGAKGQRALGGAEVVLVGASAAGTETLKNLVLPGIGSFTVIDDALVSKQDVASNFFLPTAAVGRGRAEAAAEHLVELNPDVRGSFFAVPKLSLVSDWKSLLYKNASGKKVIVIASDLEPKVLESLSALCTSEKISLIVVQSYGLMGIVRLQLPGKVPLLDPKPTNNHPDLRLKTSFPALNTMANSIDLPSLESHQHGHVPYPIVLLKALLEWKTNHDGNCPMTFVEKQEFQTFVKSKRRNENELNFEEAVQNAYLAYSEQSIAIPEDLDTSSTLGKLYEGLQKFMDGHDGRPPLNGSIPDMTASTDWYVALQGIYKGQAEDDLKAMKQLCADVSEDDISSFCANVFTVEQIETRSLVDEFGKPPDEEMLAEWKVALMDPYEVPEHTPLLWYLGVRACQVFFQKYERYPGTVVEDWESDAVLLLENCWKQVVHHYQVHDQDLVQEHGLSICQELTRYANAEIHNIASVVGGVASQEAVKIITGQYIPLDNSYVFNGIVSVAGVYKF